MLLITLTKVLALPELCRSESEEEEEGWGMRVSVRESKSKSTTKTVGQERRRERRWKGGEDELLKNEGCPVVL